MKLTYIAYINDPIPGKTTTWLDEQKAAFLLTSTELNDEIKAIRDRWKAAGHGGIKCRPKYVTQLHEKKQERQMLWIAYLEKAVCGKLDTAVAKVMKPYIDQLEAATQEYTAALEEQKNATDLVAQNVAARKVAAAESKKNDAKKAKDDCLIVAALPEFFWRDINENNKHAAGSPDGYIKGYGKPFYPAVLERLAPAAPPAAPPAAAPPPAAAETLIELTRKYPNLIVFAGTVWWKKIVDASGCKYTGDCAAADTLPTGSIKKACKAAMLRSEKMFNTLPVFYQGACICRWNKQWISTIDGLGEAYDSMEKYINRSFALSVFKDVGKPKKTYETKGTVIGLHHETEIAAEPLVNIDLNGKKISFGMDICLDIAQGYDAAKQTRTAGPMSKDILTDANKPDIQMLIAGGMPIRSKDRTGTKISHTGRIFAKCYLLRCDCVWDQDGNFADVWTANTALPDQKLYGMRKHTPGGAPPPPGDVFEIFPSVDLP